MHKHRPLMSFFVVGHPGPGGSKTFMPVREKRKCDDGQERKFLRTYWTEPTPQDIEDGKVPVEMCIGNMIDAGGDRTKDWKKAVAAKGKKVMALQDPIDLPLFVSFEFYLPRPMLHFGTGSNAGKLKADAPEFHHQDPDATKLMRSTEDALNGIVWKDDNGSVGVCSTKFWNTDNTHEGVEGKLGCWIEVSEVISQREKPLELNLECPAPTTTQTPTIATTGTSLGFNATKPGDSPW